LENETPIKKANSQQTKLHNRLLILKTIYQHDRISRAHIARETGLTRATVSDAVGELKKDGIIAEVGVGQSKGGKPPILLKFVDDARCLIGIDLAESKFRGAVINLRGEIRHRIDGPFNRRNGEDVLASVYEIIDQLLPLAASPILGIGIGTPGLVDSQQGVVRKAVNLGWDEIRLGDLLAQRYRVPVHIVNDSQAAALAEFTFGANGDEPNLIVIKMSRGIGAGIVLNRQLYCGDRFGAGELGHVVVVDDGEPCRCGHVGCLETLTGSESIVRSAKRLAAADPASPLLRFVPSPDDITIDTVARALAAGDPALAAMIGRAGRFLGIALASLVGILNVNHIVIAGSVARFGQALIEPAVREIKRRSLSPLADETTVGISTLGPDIVVLGAAALLLNNELRLP
jgi:N-acetylglucosamine repressor